MQFKCSIMIYYAFLSIISLIVRNVDSSSIVRRRIDNCYNVECSQSQPTCSLKFRGSSSPTCPNSRQIVPLNTTKCVQWEELSGFNIGYVNLFLYLIIMLLIELEEWNH